MSDPLNLQQRALLDDLCDKFENSWRNNATPSIESQLLNVEEHLRSTLLRELLLLELELLAEAGEHPTRSEYLRRFPDDRSLVLTAFRTSFDDRRSPLAESPRHVTLRSTDQTHKVYCPQCHSLTPASIDQFNTELDCEQCGHRFKSVRGDWSAQPMWLAQGRFELIERIGVGAFGAVWKAFDYELERTVAVKVPRRNDLDADEIDKFLREARAAAQLRHPNIVAVHQAGRDRELAYIVSDFVDGVTLGDWAAEQRPSSRDAADICATIAQALDHAHEQGIVHRDLKPANILVDAKGQPHLTDFGLARREAGDATMSVDKRHVGTPAYMSPEQAQGDAHKADRRSDIYSLGAILFQLLTGELPFRGDVPMLMHQAIHDDPPSPRKLNANIPKDLETITLKCLEKSPARRYQSARALAQDLGRFLRKEPIHARPVPKWERAAKWVRRHPAPSALVALLCIATLGGLAGLAWHNHTLQLNNSQLEQSRRETARQAENARRVVDVLIGAFETANPIHFGGYKFGNLSTAQTLPPREILDRGSNFIRRSAHDFEPANRAQLLDAIGNAYAGLGALGSASECLNEALAIRRELHGDAPSVDLATTLHNLGFLGFAFGRYEEAEQWLRDALEMRQALYGTQDPHHQEIALTKLMLAATLLELKFGPEIEALLRDVVSAGDGALKDHVRERAFAEAGLGLVLARQGQYLQAGRHVIAAERILRNAGDEVAAVFQRVAKSVVESQSGDDAAAADTLRGVLPEAERIVGEFHPAVHIMRIDLAKSFHRLGDFEPASEILTRTLQLARQGLGNQPRTAEAAYLLGDVLRDRQEIVAANAQYRDAYEILNECGYAERQEGAEIGYRLGMMALLERDNDSAVDTFERTLAIMEARPRHRLAAYSHIGLGLVSLAQSMPAPDKFEQGTNIMLDFPGDGPQVIAELASLGDTFWFNDMPDVAEVLFQHVLHLDEAFKLHDGFPQGRACLGLGQCLTANGRADDARPHLERALDIYAKEFGEDDARTTKVKSLLPSE